MRQLRREPFARSTFFRRSVVVDDNVSCAWCGAYGKSTNKGYVLYQYGWEDDRINTKVDFDKHEFCSVQCYRLYHNIG